MQLNPLQKEAVRYIDGPLLVLAGAGSGKTGVITQKIVHLIRQCGRAASTVYAVTFTNKAAKEMQSRVKSILSAKESKGLVISTFHSLGLSIIKSALAELGLRKGFSILDVEDCLKIVAELLKDKARDKELVNNVQMQISSWKNALIAPEMVDSRSLSTEAMQIAAALYPEYEEALTSYNACDFDSLILLPVTLFEKNKDVLNKWRQKIHYLLVDEYQDTNAAQYRLVKLLMVERQHFTVVGDDDQSIYAWRGAMPQNLAETQKDFPRLQVIKLEQNYRSSGCILTCANHLIGHNPHLFEKKLWSSLGYGELVKIVRVSDEFAEAEQVVSLILAHHLQNKTELSDYAILYRGNHQARLFEKALRDKKLAYKLSGGQSFFSKSEVKDVLAYCRLLVNSDDDNAFLRVINTPKRGIGMATIKALTAFAADRSYSLYDATQKLALQELISTKAYERLRAFYQMIETVKSQLLEKSSLLEGLNIMVRLTDYEAHLYDSYENPKVAEKKMANVFDLIQWIDKLSSKEENGELTLAEILQKLMLIDVLGKENEEENSAIELLTLHAAKGLEFPYVYLVGLEEELLPHRSSIEEGNIEEERRLLYVGITRAQRCLTLTLTAKRNRYGELSDSIPSRFLDELPKECIQWSGNREKSPSAKADGKRQLDLLKAMLKTE